MTNTKKIYTTCCCLKISLTRLPKLNIHYSITLISTAIFLGLSVNNVISDNSLGDLDLYKIVWEGPPTKALENLSGDSVIKISTQNKERYMCIVPDNSEQFNFDTSARNSTAKEKAKTPFQILEPLLRSNYCSYKFDLFWIYELCHGKFLRQYHEENTKYKAKITQEYYLGKMDPDQIKAQEEKYDNEIAELERTGQSRPTILVNGQYKPYVMVEMQDGTKCDLTKEKRIAKILYVCNEYSALEIHSIKEISTCQYEAIVLSQHLCQHKDFKSDSNTQHEIKCYSLDGSPKKPLKAIEDDTGKTSDGDEEDESRNGNKRRSVAYLQGRTLIIDADLLLS